MVWLLVQVDPQERMAITVGPIYGCVVYTVEDVLTHLTADSFCEVLELSLVHGPKDTVGRSLITNDLGQPSHLSLQRLY